MKPITAAMRARLAEWRSWQSDVCGYLRTNGLGAAEDMNLSVWDPVPQIAVWQRGVGAALLRLDKLIDIERWERFQDLARQCYPDDRDRTAVVLPENRLQLDAVLFYAQAAIAGQDASLWRRASRGLALSVPYSEQ